MKADQKVDRDRRAVALARDFLLGIEGVTAEMLEEHLDHAAGASASSLPQAYVVLIRSAQSRNRSANVIGGSVSGDILRLRSVLCGFSPRKTRARYGNDWRSLLREIVAKVKPSGRVRRTKRSLWPQFCMSVLSGAQFSPSSAACGISVPG